MENEIENLKLEIKVLQKRIESLERQRARERIIKIIKLVIFVFIIGSIVITGYHYYQEIKSYYDQISNMVTNPFNVLPSIDLPTF